MQNVPSKPTHNAAKILIPTGLHFKYQTDFGFRRIRNLSHPYKMWRNIAPDLSVDVMSSVGVRFRVRQGVGITVPECCKVSVSTKFQVSIRVCISTCILHV